MKDEEIDIEELEWIIGDLGDECPVEVWVPE